MNTSRIRARSSMVLRTALLAMMPAVLLTSPLVATAAKPLPVCVSIEAQAWLLERVGGPLVEISVLLPPGASPATWEPTPRRLAELSGTRIYFAVGVPLEASLLPLLHDGFPQLEIVSTDEGLQTLRQSADKHSGHDHGHGDFDPHIWLDPQHATTLAERMTATLARLDPANATTYLTRQRKLAAELDSLDVEVRRILEPVRGRALVVFHPAWGYFAARYGLRQIAIERGGGVPTARGLSRILEEAGTASPGAIFCQPGFDTSQATAMARQLDVPLLTLDPLARNYAENLRRTALMIREALTAEK